MAIEKQIVDDVIEITENKTVQIRQATRIIEDGKLLSSAFHRRVICPGDDFSNESDLVKDICQLVHTEQTIAAYQQMIEQANEAYKQMQVGE